jgi:transposase
MDKKTKYSREIRDRAVRLVFEQQKEYGSQWSAIGAIAGEIGCTPENLQVGTTSRDRQGIRGGCML